MIVPNDDAIADRDAHDLIANSPQQIAADAHLQPYEVPRDFLLETERFTRENGLCLDWLEQLAPTGGTVICLARGADPTAGRSAHRGGDRQRRRRVVGALPAIGRRAPARPRRRRRCTQPGLDTAEIIKPAITKRLKPINYISTVAVTALSDGGFIGKDVDVRAASPSRSLDESYASGYATSSGRARCCCARRTTCARCRWRCSAPT